MKIRLYKPVGGYLVDMLGINCEYWEARISQWTGLPVTLPCFFWEVHLYAINCKPPVKLTVECDPAKGWYSVFYSYNLNGDLKKYLEIILLRKCRVYRDQLEMKKAS